MENKEHNTTVLVIGAGISGIEVSLLLAHSGRKVYLVEKTSLIGGNVVRCEKVFTNMECATCMIAPKQQEVLGNKNIELLTLSEVTAVTGSSGNFTVTIKKKAGYVDPENCIGCSACFEPCPVELENEFEEGLGKRKAIYVPCAGALPNVPVIDTEHCLRFSGKECEACKEACMFDAIDFTQEDKEIEIKVGAIVVATGFTLFDPTKTPQYGYKELDDVYTAMEFERLFASNGPTEGNIILRNGKPPKSAAIIHCVGRQEKGYCSTVCCMYSLKFVHYFKEKLPEVKVHEFYSNLCIPGKSYQKFYQKAKEAGVNLIRANEIRVLKQGKGINIQYKTDTGKETRLPVDMVILAPAIESREDSSKLANILDIPQDKEGFFTEKDPKLASVATPKEGVFIVGCAQDPKDIQDSVAQSEAVAGRILSSFK